jgi:hypothetical protein
MSDDMTEREYERMLDTFNTASEWHSGQWSALYSYASTGKIWGEDHKADLIAEIEGCQESASTRDDLTELDISALEHLRYTVECWPNEAI